MLDADRPGAYQFERTDIDVVEAFGRFGLHADGLGLERLAPDDLCRIALGQCFDCGFRRHQRALTVQQFADPDGQHRPVALWHVELAAQIEQRALADGLALANRLDEAIGEIGFAGPGVAGAGAADEHRGDAARDASGKQGLPNKLWHYIGHYKLNPRFSAISHPKSEDFGQNREKSGEDGLKAFSHNGHTDPLIRMLDVAQAYTHRIDWSTLDQARAALAATSAFDEGAEAKLRLA